MFSSLSFNYSLGLPLQRDTSSVLYMTGILKHNLCALRVQSLCITRPRAAWTLARSLHSMASDRPHGKADKSKRCSDDKGEKHAADE